jgi:hypothetical protein
MKTKISKHESEPDGNPSSKFMLYRVKLSCKIGRDALEGKTKLPCGTTPTDYAIFNLLHAVEEIASAMMPNVPDQRPGKSPKTL